MRALKENLLGEETAFANDVMLGNESFAGFYFHFLCEGRVVKGRECALISWSEVILLGCVLLLCLWLWVGLISRLLSLWECQGCTTYEPMQSCFCNSGPVTPCTLHFLESIHTVCGALF